LDGRRQFPPMLRALKLGPNRQFGPNDSPHKHAPLHQQIIHTPNPSMLSRGGKRKRETKAPSDPIRSDPGSKQAKLKTRAGHGGPAGRAPPQLPRPRHVTSPGRHRPPRSSAAASRERPVSAWWHIRCARDDSRGFGCRVCLVGLY
uniref:Uncharacterized protein n=1 Tax=Aegilops tauschii subsp. strangulata TaxID=200361 RepID=A0A453AXX1_AEGTS